VQSTSDLDFLFYRRCFWWIFTSLLGKWSNGTLEEPGLPHPMDHLDTRTDIFRV